MKKHWLMSAAALALISTGAFAQTDGVSTASPSGAPYRHARTLEEARKHAHEYADKLDKMTPDEWTQKQSKRKAWKAKWDAMTPEEKAAYKQNHKRHRKDDAAGAATGSNAPSSAPAPEMPSAAGSPPSAASPSVTPPAASPTVPAEMSAPPMPAPSAPATGK